MCVFLHIIIKNVFNTMVQNLHEVPNEPEEKINVGNMANRK